MRRLALPFLAAMAVAAGCGGSGEHAAPAATPAGRAPRLRPDYSGTVAPPNLAPLNFIVEEPGAEYLAEITAPAGAAIRVRSRTGKIAIPERPWRKLLTENRGGELRFGISVRGADGRWQRFEPVANRIAAEPIDRYLVYRRIDPAYNYWREMEIRQRDLEGWSERRLLGNRALTLACLNCHTFLNGRGETMALGFRSREYGAGTVLARRGAAVRLATKFGYSAWHPSGRLIVYTDNQVRQFFHSARGELRDVVDLTGSLAYYDVAANALKTAPALNDPGRLASYPTWSPDGRTLYFCSAPLRWPGTRKVPPPGWERCRYDLRCVAYDAATDQWGEPEAVLSAEQTGRSLLLPRVSPDGRFLLFCACEYGCFPIFQPSSDLYLMDLASRRYRRLEVNSERSESWHSWSSNSRWIAFSSKRRDGLFTRTYLSYVDAEGKVYKPLIVPQRDPTFYDRFLKTYSVPELIADPVRVRPRRLTEAVRSLSQLAPTDLLPKKPGGP
jgi:hypothetical protein